MTQTPGIKMARSGSIVFLTLDNPKKHNAYTAAMLVELRLLFRQLQDDDETRCVVIQGEGSSFCSGSDTSEVRSVSGADAATRAHLDFSTKQAIFESNKITIAAVHGYCLGGGLELATACDFRIVDAEAIFGLPEMDLGSLPGSGGIQRLISIVGRGRTLDWVLTSRRFDAVEALAAGLATEVVPVGTARTRARELADKLATRPTVAVEVVKALLDAATLRSGSLDETVHALAAANVRYSGAIQRR